MSEQQDGSSISPEESLDGVVGYVTDNVVQTLFNKNQESGTLYHDNTEDKEAGDSSSNFNEDGKDEPTDNMENKSNEAEDYDFDEEALITNLVNSTVNLLQAHEVDESEHSTLKKDNAKTESHDSIVNTAHETVEENVMSENKSNELGEKIRHTDKEKNDIVDNNILGEVILSDNRRKILENDSKSEHTEIDNTDLNQAIADALQANFSLVDYEETNETSPESNEKEKDINKESYKKIKSSNKKPADYMIETQKVKEDKNVEKKAHELDHAELDLNQAIADALKDTESILEPPIATYAKHEETVESFDNLYHDIQTYMKENYGDSSELQNNLRSKEIESLIKGKQMNRQSKKGDDSENVEDMINQIDMNEVMQKAIDDGMGDIVNRDEENSNSELNEAIAEALQVHVEEQNKLKKKEKPKSKSRKIIKTKKSKESSSLSFNHVNIPVDAELNNAISEALKETHIQSETNTNAQLPDDSFDDAALADMVQNVVKTNLFPDDEKNEKRRDSDISEASDAKEDENDYNWDDIMGKAFEMAMGDPNDLLLDKERQFSEKNQHGSKSDIQKQLLSGFSESSITSQSEAMKESSKLKLNYGSKIPVSNGPVIFKAGPITFIQTPNNSTEGSGSMPKSGISGSNDVNGELLNQKFGTTSRFSIPSSSPKPQLASELVGNLLSSLDLGSLKAADILSKLNAVRIETLKKSVSSAITNLMSSNSSQIKVEKQKEEMDEKERIRFENRERKKRWREFNIERNRDIDLRTRVIKRANQLYPNPEHEEMKKQWIASEFEKRKQKRLLREQQSNENLLSMKALQSANSIPYETLFKDANVVKKIVDVYNALGGNVSSDKILTASADKAVTLSSTSSVLMAAYLTKNENFDDKNMNSLVSSIVMSLNTFLSGSSLGSATKEPEKSSDSNQNLKIDPGSISENNVSSGNDMLLIKNNSPNIVDSEKIKPNDHISVGHTILNTAPMSIAPRSGTVATFKVQSQVNEESISAKPPSYNADVHLTSFVKNKNPERKNFINSSLFAFKNLSLDNGEKKNREVISNTIDSIGSLTDSTGIKSSKLKKIKKQNNTPVNIEKFLSPQPPPLSLLQMKPSIPEKRKVKNLKSAEDHSIKQSKPSSPLNTINDYFNDYGIYLEEKSSTPPGESLKVLSSKSKPVHKSASLSSSSIPTIRLPQYLKPESKAIKAAVVSKVVKPINSPLVRGLSAEATMKPSAIGIGSGPSKSRMSKAGFFSLRKPGAFRKPPGFNTNSIGNKPFGGITPLKKN